MGSEGALGEAFVGHCFERECTDAVEQSVSHGQRRVLVVDADERTAREPPDHVDCRRSPVLRGFEDELDRRQGSAARERGQRPQPTLVVGEQQLVAPPDRRSERSAAFRFPAGGVAQHVEAVVEAPRDLLDRQRLCARRGQFDRQRQTVERTTELLESRRRPRQRGLVLTSRALARRVNNSIASDNASGASSNTVSPSTPSGTWLVHRIRNLGRRIEKPSREVRRRIDHVLAVVENHQRGTALEPFEQRGLAADDIQRRDQRVDDFICRRGGFEPRQPDATRPGIARLDSFCRLQARWPSSRCRRVRRSRRAASAATRSHRSASSDSRPTSSTDIDGRFPADVSRSSAAVRSGTPSDASWTRIRCSSCWSCGPGSRPSSSASKRRTRWYVASASAWRPARYSAVISSSHRLSWNGYVADGRFQLADHVAGIAESQPRRELGLRRVSSVPRRAAPGTGSTHSPSPAACSTSPRYICSVDAHRSAAPRSSPASSKRDAVTPCGAAPRTRRPRTVRPRACSRHRRWRSPNLRALGATSRSSTATCCGEW